MARVAVLGAGSWGTAFATVLCEAGSKVTMWARRSELVEGINLQNQNADYFPGVTLPTGLRATADPAEALDGASVVVLSVPSQTLRSNLASWAPALPRDAVLVSLMKGVELGTTRRMSEVIAEVAGIPASRIAVVSGPNLAAEVIRREPTASVVACEDEQVARDLQRLMHTEVFRPYGSTDVIGCELGGAYKNVIGLCVGMAVGLGFGDNTTASIMTRGLQETARLGTALGADPLTLMGLAGMGDLIATCSSPLSRNRTFGERLGRGSTVEQILASTRQVAEGAKSCASLLALAEDKGIYTPIVSGVSGVVSGALTPTDMMAAFNKGDTKPERD